jgi:hypothetical protein
MTSDGNTMVGTTYFGSPNEAVIWTASGGYQNFQSYLSSQYGLNLTGWTLNAATGITPDGTAIVGYGIDPQGYNEGFLVVVPEPGAVIFLIGTASFVILGRRRVLP